MTIDLFLETARQVVQNAAETARRLAGRATVVCEKAFGDIVTEGDLEVEKIILSQIGRLYPDHGFFSEEAGERRADAEYVWVLDPAICSCHFMQCQRLFAVIAGARERSIHGSVVSCSWSSS
ncbi:MAG: inositol monophosphatase family protein, partial [Planctomycetota bacterium]